MNNDWRLELYKGQFEGKVFELKEFHSTKKNDHEHCEFSWKKITDLAVKDADKDGYMLYDDKSKQSHWICQSCFNDFKEKLNLKTINDILESTDII